ncbi:protein EFR3 homolog B-like [Dendronephthya gigantea]|uniref:protein EFR3 homolog B-like n=1 Tax=Dendronephthya gigantea TaxID=151771 RepID=UPI00106D6D78|nr:protein EFR3 homolog B-like [Dendronephthya gigantea]
MATSQLCSCFGQLRPKYKRKVDQIFPRDARDGLVKSNMDKLIFYALSSPEKLDRIGAYLNRKLESHIYWRRYGFVLITMEAMEQLLSACHAPDINLFVASFLKMVQKLLESSETDLQIRGTESFVIFANIEEDTPSYHREYDFFVSKFSEMCYHDCGTLEEDKKIKIAGLSGLQGIFRKTVSDDLQVNIWDQEFMGKIIPSLLHVLEHGQSNQEAPINSENEPCSFAEAILHEIVSQASFGNVRAGIEPVLLHLDSAKLWFPSEFAIHCFKIILYSVQNQYSYLVIQMLLNHLNKHVNSSLEMKTNVVEVISTSVAIASAESIGASVLEVFNTLLHHLRLSVDARGENSQSQEAFEQAIIKTVGIFAQVLPDYQKSEIMMFIMGKLPVNTKNISQKYSYQRSQSIESDDHENNQQEALQEMYLLCILKVAVVYKSEKLSTTFPDTLLDSLLKVSISRNIRISKLAHEILQTLLDRQANLPKLTIDGLTKTIEQNGIVIKKCTKADIVFFQKKKDELFWHIYQSASNRLNRSENIFSIYKSLILLSVEINDSGVLIEMIRFVLSLQLVNGENTLTRAKVAIHATVCACLNFIAELMGITRLRRYIASCIKMRQNYEYLSPSNAFTEEEDLSQTEFPGGLFISLEDVSKALEEGGFETKMLSSPYVPEPVSELHNGQQDEKSQSLRSETGSLSSAEGVHFTIAEEVTFDTLKDVLYRNASQSMDGHLDLYNATFNDIAAVADGRAREFNVKIDDVLEASDLIVEMNTMKETPSMSSLPGEDNYEMRFLDKYVY